MAKRSKSQFRITVRAGDTLMRLVSVRLNQHGDLILAPAFGDRYRAPNVHRNEPSEDDHHDRRMTEHRYTVHRSGFDNHHNRINCHVILSGGRKVGYATMSAAIKRDRTFFPLFSSRPVLIASSNTTGPKIIELDSFDEKHFTIIFSVFVSDANIFIASRANDYARVHSIVVGNFRLTFSWSYINHGSIGLGAQMSTLLESHKYGASNLSVSSGLTATECFDRHMESVNYLINELLETLWTLYIFDNQEDADDFQTFIHRSTRVFSRGSLDNPTYIEFRKNLEPLGRKMNVRMYTGWDEKPEKA